MQMNFMKYETSKKDKRLDIYFDNFFYIYFFLFT